MKKILLSGTWGWGFSSVALPPASQAQGPEFDLQYKKTKQNKKNPKTKNGLRHLEIFVIT